MYEIGNNITLPEGDDNELRGKKYRIRRENNVKPERYKKKLETDYLAESLRGHMQYFATSYSRSPDHEGRAAIRYDGKEIIKGCF